MAEERKDDRGKLVKVVLEFENGTMWVEDEAAAQWQSFVGSMEALYMSRGWPMEPIAWNYEEKPKASPAPKHQQPPQPKNAAKRAFSRKTGKGGKKKQRA